MSHMKLVTQYIVGLMPLTNCKCLLLETRSSIRKRTKLAGTKDMAKITQMATTTFTALFMLQQDSV